MAYYDLKHELRDGRILIYTQKNAKSGVWQMRLNVRGYKGYVTKSTKTKNIAEAIRTAEDEYDRLQTNIREGADVKEWTFEDHWKDWYDRNIKAGAWKLERQKWHKSYFNRYFSEYFKGKRLNEINAEFADRYWEWRVAYWQTGTGAEIREKEAQRRNSKLIPAAKTLKMEQSALRQILHDAHNLRRMRYLPDIKAKVGRVTSKRASFDEHEYRLLARKLSHYAKGWAEWQDDDIHSRHRIQRQMLRVYVLFIANTGLRTGEANVLRGLFALTLQVRDFSISVAH